MLHDPIFVSSTHEGDFYDTWRVGMSLTEGDFFPISGGDFYLIYRDRNNSEYDYSQPVARMEEDDASVDISDMVLEPAVGRNIWHFTRKAVSKYGVLSADADDCLVTVDSDAVMVLPCGNAPSGPSAKAIKDGAVRLQWQYFSQGEDATPTGFKIYTSRSDDFLTVTGTLSPDITGDFVNIGPQVANGAYDPTEPDPDVYYINIDGTDWYIWHDSEITEYWYITNVVGDDAAATRWYRAYASGIIGAYLDVGLATGTATVAVGIGSSDWALQSDIDFTGGRNYQHDVTGLIHDINYRFTIRTYRTVAAVDYETVNEIVVEARADDTGPAAITSITATTE